MESPSLKTQLPPIPAKRYFTIGEVSELCGVKPHVLRYWEQEFTQLKPVKRRGNRRYYQHHEVLLIRRIRELLYDQGFTISGARNRLDELSSDGGRSARTRATDVNTPRVEAAQVAASPHLASVSSVTSAASVVIPGAMRKEIQSVLAILRA
jgi:DNA-binding transcriptional MerR regulator